MNQLEISVEPRTVLGKKVRHLREQGFVPANVYGHGIASYPIQVEAKELQSVIQRAGTSRLIALRLPKERSARQVLVRHIEHDPVSRKILHVDFYEVRMTERLKAEVRLNFVGEAPGVIPGQGLLLHALDTVEVECLPSNLPQSIKVDLSGLAEVDDAIHVRDLDVPSGVTILTPPDELIAKIAPVRVEEEAVKPKAEEVEAPEAAGRPSVVREAEEEEEAA